MSDEAGCGVGCLALIVILLAVGLIGTVIELVLEFLAFLAVACGVIAVVSIVAYLIYKLFECLRDAYAKHKDSEVAKAQSRVEEAQAVERMLTVPLETFDDVHVERIARKYEHALADGDRDVGKPGGRRDADAADEDAADADEPELEFCPACGERIVFSGQAFCVFCGASLTPGGSSADDTQGGSAV